MGGYMRIKRLIGGELMANGYIISDRSGGECYIIDPGYDYKYYVDYINKENLKLKGILLTHHHYDHTGAVGDLKKVFDVPICIHSRDMSIDVYRRKPDVFLADGDVLMLGDEKLQVINTPGHTHGSVCFFSEENRLAFTGDTIFNVDLGTTELADGSMQEMRESIINIIDKWSDDITIYPGHGDECTMGYVRKINREFLDIAGEKNDN